MFKVVGQILILQQSGAKEGNLNEIKCIFCNKLSKKYLTLKFVF